MDTMSTIIQTRTRLPLIMILGINIGLFITATLGSFGGEFLLGAYLTELAIIQSYAVMRCLYVGSLRRQQLRSFTIAVIFSFPIFSIVIIGISMLGSAMYGLSTEASSLASNIEIVSIFSFLHATFDVLGSFLRQTFAFAGAYFLIPILFYLFEYGVKYIREREHLKSNTDKYFYRDSFIRPFFKSLVVLCLITVYGLLVFEAGSQYISYIMLAFLTIVKSLYDIATYK